MNGDVRHCGNCGAVLGAGARNFCEHCGAALTAATPSDSNVPPPLPAAAPPPVPHARPPEPPPPRVVHVPEVELPPAPRIDAPETGQFSDGPGAGLKALLVSGAVLLIPCCGIGVVLLFFLWYFLSAREPGG